MDIQKTLINRINAVYSHDTTKPAALTVLGAALVNLQNLGYVFDEKDHDKVTALSTHVLEDIVAAARAIRGDDEYSIMYPNFPQQVMEASEAELYVNALLHYTGDIIGLRITPVYPIEVREKLDEKVSLTKLSFADSDDVQELFIKIAKSGQPFSEQDKTDLVVLHSVVGNVEIGDISVKENLAWLAKTFAKIDFSDSFKTVTDVLRLAVAFSDGDISLAENTKFKLSRPNRRIIVSLLDEILSKNNNNVEDFGRYAETWKRLAYALHHHEFDSVRVSKALNTVQSSKIKSFDSNVETLIAIRDLKELLNVLSARPGIFARRLHEILRKFDDSDRSTIVDAFSKVSDKVSVRVLVQMWNYFNGPNSDVLENVVFDVKSRNQRSGVKKNIRVGDYSDVVDAIENGLKNRFGKKVFLKKDDNSYAVPLGVRSASDGMNIVGRGSRSKIGFDKGTVRMFMHWHDTMDDFSYNSTVDLDLSAFFMNATFTNAQTISYYNLRSDEAYHSGDITSAPDGAAEFIDININKALAHGWRYVGLTVYSYTGQTFDTVPEAWAGVMLRDKPQSGEVFEASTVSSRFDLNNHSTNSTPVVFDLVTREMVWLDSSVSVNPSALNNVASNESRLTVAMKSVLFSQFMTVDKLVELSAVVVDSEAEADIVIDSSKTADVLQLLS